MDLMVQPELRFTRADLDLIPEELRVELIDGQLLKMTFPSVQHQKVVHRWDRMPSRSPTAADRSRARET